MKAAWIAQALREDRQALDLSLADLVEWQLSGCRSDNGSPYGMFGSYALAAYYGLRHKLAERLKALPPNNWPAGMVVLGDHNYRSRVCLPPLEGHQVSDDRWRVPVYPTDLGHALDGWCFGLSLSEEDFDVLKSVAGDLVQRCLLVSYCRTLSSVSHPDLPWDGDRLNLARLANIELNDLSDLYRRRRLSSTQAPGEGVPNTVGLAVAAVPGRSRRGTETQPVLTEAELASLVNQWRPGCSGGSFEIHALLPNGEAVVYRFAQATGMRWQSIQQRYRAVFGEYPDWLLHFHLIRRCQFCEHSLARDEPLPDSVDTGILRGWADHLKDGAPGGFEDVSTFTSRIQIEST
jgi:hypothetical protein